MVSDQWSVVSETVLAMGKKFTLPAHEVSWSWQGAAAGKPGQFGRREKLTGCTMVLRHRPTNLQVQGEIPPGHYSKREMQRCREALRRDLFAALEFKVSRHLAKEG